MAFRWMDCREGLRSVYHLAFRVVLWVKCGASDLAGRGGRGGAAVPPALLRYRVGESLNVREFLAVGAACAAHIDECLEMAGIRPRRGERVLDFGCGCGRVLPFLKKRYWAAQFHGVDVDAEAIAWCSRHIADAVFQCTGPLPPLPYPGGYFDLIYAISVFTHLDEAMQDRWLEELHRVLRPGGTLVLTVHGERAAAALANADKDALERQGFLHKSSRKLRGIVPAWYHTTWHMPGYIVERMARHRFEASYRAIEDSTQAFVIGRGCV